MDRYGQRRGQLAAQKNRPFQSPVKLFHFQNYHVSHYQSIRIGLGNNVSSLRRLSLLSYNQLARYDSPSCYKLCAISRAAGVLAARNKSVRRGFPTRTPYGLRQQLVSCYGFKTKNGGLEIPVARGKRLSIPLTKHTINVISQPEVEVRSFTLTHNRLCL